jgi:hypothetical protein
MTVIVWCRWYQTLLRGPLTQPSPRKRGEGEVVPPPQPELILI